MALRTLAHFLYRGAEVDRVAKREPRGVGFDSLARTLHDDIMA